MFDFEIKKVRPEAAAPAHSEEIKRKQKDIKSQLGKAAFIETFGPKGTVLRVSSGIQRSKGALRWISDTFEEEK